MREAVWNLEPGGILLGPIQRARGKHDLGNISFLPRMRFPELTSRGSIAVDTGGRVSLLFVGSWAYLRGLQWALAQW